ncbi:MAG: hypothetical protein AB7F35_05035 [Acetobacteraceae bacterium]
MSEADPFALSDPLEAMPPPERVNYATGVLLDAEDFRAEQTYHRGRLATVLRHLAGFGTLAGLRVIPPEENDSELELGVAPGVAIDRFGRLIELQAPQCIRLARWFAAETTPRLRSAVHRAPRVSVPVAVVVDVFLSAMDCARGKTPAFATGPFDALDAVVPSRLAETVQLELVMRTEGGPDPIPTPTNFWPAADATAEDKLQAVLGSWDGGTATSQDGMLEPLAEHVQGHEPSALLLARVTIPVTLDEADPPTTRPVLDLTTRVSVDNSLRPFVFLPGKWFGRAFDAAPLVQP